MSISGDEKLGRLSAEGITNYTRPQLLGIRDPTVKFEEYVKPILVTTTYPYEKADKVFVKLLLILGFLDTITMPMRLVPKRTLSLHQQRRKRKLG